MNRYTRVTLASAIALCLALVVPGLAHGAGTGDDPRRTNDVLTVEQSKQKAADDAWFASWKAAKTIRTSSALRRAGKTASIRPLLIDGPNASFWTPSHRQERPYWCGPATCQIITHYWGRLVPQWAFAQYMGTTTAGTDFTKVDDALRYYSFKSYWYTGGVTTFNVFMDMCEFGMGEKRYPIVANVRIEADRWPFYEFDHAGHIVPIEMFDESITPYRVRLNDPYDEEFFAGGGNTFGHTTYPAYVVARGVNIHWRQAMVR